MLKNRTYFRKGRKNDYSHKMRFKKCIASSVSYHPALERKIFIKNRLFFFTLGSGLKHVDKENFFDTSKDLYLHSKHGHIQNMAFKTWLFTAFLFILPKKCTRQVRKVPWYI